MRRMAMLAVLAAVAGCEPKEPDADVFAPPLSVGQEMYAISSDRGDQEVIVRRLSGEKFGLGRVANGTKVRVVEAWKDVAEEQPDVKVLVLEGRWKDHACEVSRRDLVPVTRP